MTRGRRLAFDYGEIRIGVAVSDPDSILASPVVTLESRSSGLWESITDLIVTYEPVEVFVGLPTHLAGHESPSTSQSRSFALLMEEKFHLPVTLVDERLSTVSAQRQLKEAGVSSRKSKSAIDQMAAVAILQQGLEINAHRSKRKDDA